MKTISNNLLIYNDENYKHAVNYSSSFYNNPVTLNYGDKHERTKYILGSGSSDSISLVQNGIYIYVISENYLLNYISLTEINTEQKSMEEVFFDSNEIDNNEMLVDIFEMKTEEQIKILTQYLD